MSAVEFFRRFRERWHLIVYGVLGAIVAGFVIANSQKIVVRFPLLGEFNSPAWFVMLVSGLLGAGVLKLVQLLRRLRQR